MWSCHLKLTKKLSPNRYFSKCSYSAGVFMHVLIAECLFSVLQIVTSEKFQEVPVLFRISDGTSINWRDIVYVWPLPSPLLRWDSGICFSFFIYPCFWKWRFTAIILWDGWIEIMELCFSTRIRYSSNTRLRWPAPCGKWEHYQFKGLGLSFLSVNRRPTLDALT